MNNKLYNDSATVQLSSHDIMKEALNASVTRILSYKSSDKPQNPLRIADLGSAGGVNAIQLLRYVEGILHEKGEHLRPIEYYFEELPTSDFNELIKTIHASNLSDQFYPMVIGKSFYKKLFPPSSVDLFLSYITLHWLSKIPGNQIRIWRYFNQGESFILKVYVVALQSLYRSISIFSEINENEAKDSADIRFFEGNETNTKPDLYEKFRSAAIDDLKIFLKLRADELTDNGEGLFLMVGNDYKLNKNNRHCGREIEFLGYKKLGSIFKEAFENTAKDVQNENIANKIKRPNLASFIQYFLRSESDVLESFDYVKDVLELKELKWKNCPLACGSPEKLSDLIWSIHGNYLKECIKETVIKEHSIDVKEKDDVSNGIIESLKRNINILTKRDFPDGDTMGSYMYMVVKRKPRI